MACERGFQLCLDSGSPCNWEYIAVCKKSVDPAHVQGVTESCAWTSGTSITYQSKKNAPYQHVSGSYGWKNAPTHFSRTMPDVISNIYHDQWIGRGGPTAWSHACQIWILWIFTCGNTENPCVSSSCWQRRGISPSYWGLLPDCPQDAVGFDETRRGEHWISRKAFGTHKSTLPAVNHKCSRTHVDMAFCVRVYVMWNSWTEFVRTFQLHSVYRFTLPTFFSFVNENFFFFVCKSHFMQK
jgi:hypothetical protein